MRFGFLCLLFILSNACYSQRLSFNDLQNLYKRDIVACEYFLNKSGFSFDKSQNVKPNTTITQWVYKRKMEQDAAIDFLSKKVTNDKCIELVYTISDIDQFNSIKSDALSRGAKFISITSSTKSVSKFHYLLPDSIEMIFESPALTSKEVSEIFSISLREVVDLSVYSDTTQFDMVYLDNANLARRRGEYKLAIANLDTLIAIHPHIYMSYEYRGDIYQFSLGESKLAIADFTKAIQLQPDNVNSYFYRGKAYYDLGLKQKAIDDFTTTLKLDPENTDAYFMRGLLKSDLKDRMGAISDYDEILKREKTAKPTLYDMGTVYNNKGYCLIELNRLDEALPFITKAIEMEPKRSYIWGSRGHLFYLKGDFINCIADMTRAIELSSVTTNSSDPAFPYYFRGLARIKLGQLKEGCADLTKANEMGKSEAHAAILKNCK